MNYFWKLFSSSWFHQKWIFKREKGTQRIFKCQWIIAFELPLSLFWEQASLVIGQIFRTVWWEWCDVGLTVCFMFWTILYCIGAHEKRYSAPRTSCINVYGSFWMDALGNTPKHVCNSTWVLKFTRTYMHTDRNACYS